MKKIILVIFMLVIFALSSSADILAHSSKSIKYYGIGILNMPGSVIVYKEPDKNSEVMFEIDYTKQKKSSIVMSNESQKISFVTYIPSENIALLTVEMNPQNGWYNVYLNQKTGETGWVYTEDENAFFTYKSLFYKYGKKNGIRIFTDLPEDKKVIYSKQSETSQKLEQLSYPKYVDFTVISGNWMLIKVNDMSKHAKVGWFNWRNDDGTLNMFPNFK